MLKLKTILSLALGLTLLMAAQAGAQTVPTTASYGELFGTRTGDAYSSVLLHEMFGPLFPSAALPEGSEGVRTVFSSIIGYFNVIMLVVGGLMFFYNVTVGVLQSAHEGQVLGQRWSSLWAPLRVLFAVGLLVPVPTYGGYNLAQVGVAYVVKGSTNIATKIWTASVDLILEDGIPIATSESRFSTDTIRTLYENASCMALLNYQFISIGSPRRVVYAPAVLTTTSRVTNEETFPRYGSTTMIVGDGDPRSAGICGSWYTPEIPAYILRVIDENGLESDVSDQILTKFVEGHRDIMQSIAADVEQYLVTGSGSAAPIRQDVFENILEPAPFTSRLQDISVNANRMLASLVTELRGIANGASGHGRVQEGLRARITGSCTTDGAESRSGQCYGEGWIGAGAYYTTLARMNAEINSLSSAQSVIHGRTFMVGVGLSQDGFVREAGGYGLLGGLFGRNSTGDRMPTAEEAERILTRYDDLFKVSSYPLAALGFQMATADIISANGDPGSATSSTISEILESISGSIQETQASILKFMNPTNSLGGDPMVGLIETGHLLLNLGLVIVIGTVAPSFLVPGLAVMMLPLLSLILATGSTLSFILPLMPFFYWILGVSGYFLLIVEAIVAVNLWALAHMRMDGDGISGMAGQKGWLMLLALLMTPILMIFGFLIGMGIFRIVSILISSGIFYAISGISGGANPWIAFVSTATFVVMIVAVYMILVERSFALISEFPNRVMQWMGEGINIGGGEGRIQMAAGAAGVATNQMGNAIEKPFTQKQQQDGSMMSDAQKGIRGTGRIAASGISAITGGRVNLMSARGAGAIGTGGPANPPSEAGSTGGGTPPPKPAGE